MKLLVFSHKKVWRSSDSPSGWATDGGFAFQMMAVGSLFDEVEMLLPEVAQRSAGEVFFKDEKLTVTPIQVPASISGWKEKLFVLFWGFWNLRHLFKKIKQADVVHVPIPSSFGTIGMWFTKWLNKPLFIRYCGNWLVSNSKVEVYWKRYMIKHAGKNMVAFATGGDSNPPSEKNKQIKWIFSSSLLADELAQLEEKVKAKPTTNTFNVVAVSRQVKNKGTDKTIKAIAQLKDKSIHFDIVGDGGDLDYFKQVAKEQGIEDQVHFHGKLNNQQVIATLLQGDVFCFPSMSEGFPKAVMEAMACGLPVITNPVSVLPSMVGDTDSGIILSKGDVDDIATQLKLLKDNPEKRSTCTNNALAAVKQYSLENWADYIAKEFAQTFQIETHRKRSLVK